MVEPVAVGIKAGDIATVIDAGRLVVLYSSGQ
jgi:hypothetical protein